MTPLEMHDGLAALRGELEQVREILDQTDAVLEVADETLARAAEIVRESRVLLPAIIVSAALAGVVGAAFVAWRRRSQHTAPVVEVEAPSAVSA